MKETFKVTVPGNVRTGDQEVKVYGDDEDLNTTSATATSTSWSSPWKSLRPRWFPAIG